MLSHLRTRKNPRRIPRLKSLTAITALNELHKRIGDLLRLSIRELEGNLVGHRAGLTQFSIHALFNRLVRIVQTQMTVALDELDDVVEVWDLNRNVIDVILVKKGPGHIVVLFLNPLVILIGFDLLEHRFFILTEEDTETGAFQPNRMYV